MQCFPVFIAKGPEGKGEHLSKKMPRVQVCQSYKFLKIGCIFFNFLYLLITKPNQEDYFLSAVLFWDQYFPMKRVLYVTINCIYNVGYDGMDLSITSLTWLQDL